MKQGRLHTGPPLALQPLQAEMARKKVVPKTKQLKTKGKSHVVTVTTCDSEHSIQGAVLRPLCKSYDLCYTYTGIYPDQNGHSHSAHPFISFVWFSLLSKHF